MDEVQEMQITPPEVPGLTGWMMSRTSIGVLAILTALFVGIQCSSKEEPARSPEVKAPRGAVALLPKGDEAAGWTRAAEPRMYGPEDLYEYINGAADAYLAYGFQEVATADYGMASRPELQVVIDIYRMRDSVHAFGIYSSERAPTYTFTGLGAEGYVGEANVTFWKDAYYVKLVTFEASEEARAGMLALANAIAAKIPGPSEAPALLHTFPEDGQEPRSSLYVSRNVLGHAFLSNGYLTEYRIGDETFKLFLIEGKDTEDAAGAFRAYRAFLMETGGKAGDIGLGEESFAVQDSFYGEILALRTGKYLAGALGAPDRATGTQLLQEMVGRLGN